MRLHVDLVQAPGATPTRAFLFLHGILGQGTNLRTLARRFVEARPSLQAVLVDLRAHGASQGVEGDDSVVSAADDVAQTARDLALPAAGVCGHSFGGKVAMLLAERAEGLEHLVVLDSTPGTRADFRGSETTLRVLSALDDAPARFPSRDAFVAHLGAAGLDRGVATWLGMNLERADDGFRFTLSLARIRALLASYFAHDCWPLLERLALDAGPAFHLVVGDRSTVFDAHDRERAAALAARSHGRCTVDVVPAGHWVHVDDPEGTLRVLLARVPAA
ncbi:MAG: alpha/beta hydrolase [Myxococcaceae bacterium]|jgi:esterase|nr:alpha/beta hydrolase [Myxococcaceae bacterium]MCA3015193.1 alpha/beta hydrolase [Myxococcaceae bacterium]